MFWEDSGLSHTQQILCGIVSGLLARTVTAPLDVTKVLYQVGVPYANERCYLAGGLYSLTQYIRRTEGLRALYSGNLTSCVRVLPATAIQTIMYFTLTKQFSKRPDGITMASTIFIGATAGYASTIFTYPMDTIKTRMIVQSRVKKTARYKSIYDCWKKMINEEGRMAPWKGLFPTLIATIMSSISLFATYELLRCYYPFYIPEFVGETEIHGRQLTHGFTAAVISLLLTHPLDTCCKKMQAFSLTSPNRGGVDFHVRGFIQCWRHIYRTQTVFGLYAGFAPAFIRLVPFNMLMLWTYGRCRQYCIRYNGVTERELQRLMVQHEDDLQDLEYTWLDDLPSDDTPDVKLAKLYVMEQKHMQLVKKKKRLSELFDKLFKLG